MSTATERGSVTPMLIGLGAILLILVGVVIDASSAFMHRQQLDTYADGAALAAAEGGSSGYGVYDGGLGERLLIDAGPARQAAGAYLRKSGAYADYPGLDFKVIKQDDTIAVSIAARVHLPLRIPDGPGNVAVSATGSASVVVAP